MSKHIFKAVEDIEGKVVIKVEEIYEGVALATAEGFLFLTTKVGYEGDTSVIVEVDRNEIMSDWSHAALVRLGFATQKEIDASSRARKDKHAKLREISDRAQYEALKRRFGKE